MSRFLRTLERVGLGSGVPELSRAVERCAAMPAITKIDHVTFVTTPKQKQQFIERWEARGFAHHGTWHTDRYAASHTALVSGVCEEYPWAEMVGLSVKTDTGVNPPLERSLHDLDGVEQAQHVAFNVDARVDATELFSQQQQLGFEMMTPVLNYTGSEGAGLRQWFTRPVNGFFIEFAQRLPDVHGQPFGGFHPETIEDLYEALDREHHAPRDVIDFSLTFGEINDISHYTKRDLTLQPVAELI